MVYLRLNLLTMVIFHGYVSHNQIGNSAPGDAVTMVMDRIIGFFHGLWCQLKQVAVAVLTVGFSEFTTKLLGSNRIVAFTAGFSMYNPHNCTQLLECFYGQIIVSVPVKSVFPHLVAGVPSTFSMEP